jgi:probable HAF family extracellular repeat protein
MAYLNDIWHRTLVGLCFLTFATTTASLGWSQSLTWLGSLDNRLGSLSIALDVSPDGATCVGWSHNAAGRQHAFRWTHTGGMQDLGTLSIRG